jgi:hypothetical protein
MDSHDFKFRTLIFRGFHQLSNFLFCHFPAKCVTSKKIIDERSEQANERLHPCPSEKWCKVSRWDRDDSHWRGVGEGCE